MRQPGTFDTAAEDSDELEIARHPLASRTGPAVVLRHLVACHFASPDPSGAASTGCIRFASWLSLVAMDQTSGLASGGDPNSLEAQEDSR